MDDCDRTQAEMIAELEDLRTRIGKGTLVTVEFPIIQKVKADTPQ